LPLLIFSACLVFLHLVQSNAQSFPVPAVSPCSFTTNQQLELQLQESRSRSATAADADAAKLEDLYAALEISRGEILEEQARSEKLEAQVRALEKAKEEAARAEALEAKNAQLESQLQNLMTQSKDREELQSQFLELKEAAKNALSAAKAAQAEETGALRAQHEAKMEECDKAIEGLQRKLSETTRQLEAIHTQHIQAYSDLLKEFDEYKDESSILEQKLLQAEHDYDQKLSLLKQELEAKKSETEKPQETFQQERALDEARAADHKVQQQQDQIQMQTQSISDLTDQIEVRLFMDLPLHSTSPDFLHSTSPDFFACHFFHLVQTNDEIFRFLLQQLEQTKLEQAAKIFDLQSKIGQLQATFQQESEESTEQDDKVMQNQVDALEESISEINDLKFENARLQVELDAMVHERLKESSLVAEENMREDAAIDYIACLKLCEEENQSLQQDVDGLEHMLKIAMLREQELVKRVHGLQMVVAMRDAEISEHRGRLEKRAQQELLLERAKTQVHPNASESPEEIARIEHLCHRIEEICLQCLNDADTQETLVLCLRQDSRENQRQFDRVKADNKCLIEELKVKNERIEELDQNLSIIYEQISLLEARCEDLEVLPEFSSMIGGFIRQQKIQVQRLQDELMFKNAKVADTITNLMKVQEELQRVKHNQGQHAETIGLLRQQVRDQEPIVQDLVKAMVVRDAEVKYLRSELQTKERDLILTSALKTSSIAADLAIYNSADLTKDFDPYRSISRASSRGSILVMPPPENDMELMERRMMGLDPEEDPEILELLSRSSSKVRGSSRDSAQAQPAVSQSPCRPDSALSQRSAVSSLKSAKNPADLQHNQIGDEAIKILRSASSSSLKSAHSLQELEDASRQAEVFLSVCLTLYYLCCTGSQNLLAGNVFCGNFFVLQDARTAIKNILSSKHRTWNLGGGS
jgi:hypothetical protein